MITHYALRFTLYAVRREETAGGAADERAGLCWRRAIRRVGPVGDAAAGAVADPRHAGGQPAPPPHGRVAAALVRAPATRPGVCVAILHGGRDVGADHA